MTAEGAASRAEQQLIPALKRPLLHVSLLAAAARLARLAALLGLAALAGGLVMDGRVTALGLSALLCGSALSVGLSVLVERRVIALEEETGRRVIGWFDRLLSRGAVRPLEGMDAGDLVSRLSRQPGAAAAALVSVAVARKMAGIGAVTALLLMAFYSWPAALLLALSMPVMVLFFALVGELTKSRANAQEKALQSLSASFADRVRCLPTIVACHAVPGQTGKLRAELHAYRAASNDVLKTAFLNAGVLDFFSSLSIAMLAVFLGLGHLGLADVPGFSGLSLTASLSLLVLAPEVFQPFRKYADLYHKAAEGKAALHSLDDILDIPPAVDRRLPLTHVGARDLVLGHGLHVPNIDLPQSGLVAVIGPSGVGKTTLLRALAGVDTFAGQVFRMSGKAAWASTDAWLPNGPFRQVLGRDHIELLRELRLTDDPRFSAKGAAISDHGADFSGGQRLRLSLAAAASSDADVLFADEPTAKLDPSSAAAVRGTLQRLAADRLVVAVTHDPLIVQQAEQVIVLDGSEVDA